MTKDSKKGQAYRHTPAFILLFLAKEDFYGASLLNTIQRDLALDSMDSPVIYRTLRDLEAEGSVESYWETNITGPARKWYKITSKGLDKLENLKEDIEMRRKVFDNFIEIYNKLK